MTKRCVVCGEKTREDYSALCVKHGKGWDVARNPAEYIARQVRAVERRRYRELLQVAEELWGEYRLRPAQFSNNVEAHLGRLITAVRNAKARRSR